MQVKRVVAIGEGGPHFEARKDCSRRYYSCCSAFFVLVGHSVSDMGVGTQTRRQPHGHWDFPFCRDTAHAR